MIGTNKKLFYDMMGNILSVGDRVICVATHQFQRDGSYLYPGTITKLSSKKRNRNTYVKAATLTLYHNLQVKKNVHIGYDKILKTNDGIFNIDDLIYSQLYKD